MMERQQGFSLIELLLSVAIIGILVGFSMPIYQSFQSRNDLDILVERVADMLRRGQTYARGVNGDSTWGVHVQADSTTLFKGASYATRDASYDETTPIPSNITVAGMSDVVFSKLTAAPGATGTITLTQTNTNDVKTVSVNAKGMVSY